MDWNTENNKLVKEFKFNNFVEALAFMVRVGELAESLNHHPKIINEYNNVRLELCTHSEGHVVTSKDWELANGIDAL